MPKKRGLVAVARKLGASDPGNGYLGFCRRRLLTTYWAHPLYS